MTAGIDDDDDDYITTLNMILFLDIYRYVKRSRIVFK